MKVMISGWGDTYQILIDVDIAICHILTYFVHTVFYIQEAIFVAKSKLFDLSFKKLPVCDCFKNDFTETRVRWFSLSSYLSDVLHGLIVIP